MIDFDTFKILSTNVGDLGKLIVTKGLKSCPKSNISAQSGHTVSNLRRISATVIKMPHFFKVQATY